MILDEKFLKEERLVKTKDFRRVYKKGLFFKKDGLILYRLSNALLKNRLGISIQSKNIRLASRRNRYKRLLREAYRKNKKTLTKGYDIVLVVKKDLSRSVTYSNIESPFLKLAKDSGLLA